MGAVPVALVPGDGIGPSVVSAARAVLDAAGASIEWVPVTAGSDAFEATGSALPQDTVDAVVATGVVLKGPMATPRHGYRSPNQGLRSAVGTFVNVRRAVFFDHPGARYPGLDVTLVRDLTEDFVGSTGQRLGDDLAGVAVRVTTRPMVERLALFTYDWAVSQGLRRVVVGHLATSQRANDGLFLETALSLAPSGLSVSEEALDPLCVHLLQDPTRYDIVLTTQLYGGILCGVLAGLMGSVGLLAGAAFGPTGAIFEPGHGNATKHTGSDRANPAATILSGAMLLDHIDQAPAATRVRRAVAAAIASGAATPDLGGTGTTTSFTRACCELL